MHQQMFIAWEHRGTAWTGVDCNCTLVTLWNGTNKI